MHLEVWQHTEKKLQCVERFTQLKINVERALNAKSLKQKSPSASQHMSNSNKASASQEVKLCQRQIKTSHFAQFGPASRLQCHQSSVNLCQSSVSPLLFSQTSLQI